MNKNTDINLCPKIILLLLILSFDIYSYKKTHFSKWPNTLYKTYIINKGLTNFLSYSEYYEDLILYLLLFDIEKGFYIDVGAYDPIKVSVTKFFYSKGWRGINIEPLPGKIELFQKERPNDINLQLAVGEKKGNVTFYIKGQLSSVDEQYCKNCANKTIIEMDTLSNICETYVPKGTQIDFCKIDVEGSEKSVLLGANFINYRPKVFCIESVIPIELTPNYELWEDILIKNNYSFIYSEGVNRFYVDNQIPGLIKRDKYIRKYLKNFRKYRRRHGYH